MDEADIIAADDVLRMVSDESLIPHLGDNPSLRHPQRVACVSRHAHASSQSSRRPEQVPELLPPRLGIVRITIAGRLVRAIERVVSAAVWTGDAPAIIYLT